MHTTYTFSGRMEIHGKLIEYAAHKQLNIWAIIAMHPSQQLVGLKEEDFAQLAVIFSAHSKSAKRPSSSVTSREYVSHGI